MFDESTTNRTACSGSDPEDGQSPPTCGLPVIGHDERLAHWLNPREMCLLASVRQSTASHMAWRTLVDAAQDGGTAAIAGRHVRMARRVVRDRECVYMHADDAHAASDPFRALVRSFEKRLEKQFGRYDPEMHAEWLDFSAVSETLGPEFALELLRSLWLRLSEDLRAGCRTSIAGEHVRTRLLARAGSRIRLHIHTDDLHLIDWRRYRNDGRFLTLRQIVDHFKAQDVWMGIVAERLMTRAGAALRSTGRHRLRGVDLGGVAVPTSRGLQMRVPATSLVQVERIVNRINDWLIDSDFNYIPPKDEELGSFVDHREFEPAAMTMAPY